MTWVNAVDSPESDEAEATLLRAISVDMGHGRRLSLHDLITSWHRDVERLRREAAGEAADPRSTRNEHDYVGVLLLRDRLENALREVGHHRARTLVDQVDATLRSFTGESPAELLAGIADVSPHDRAWWWRRIPSTGPLRRDLQWYLDNLDRTGTAWP